MPNDNFHGRTEVGHDHSGSRLGESSPVESIHTDQISTKGVVGVNAASPNGLFAEKSTWSWDSLNWEDFGGPIETGDDLNGSAAYSSWMPGSVFDNPIDDWYIIWSSHDFNDMGISTTSDPWSELTYQASLSDPEGSQTASPHWVYVPEEDVVRVYYHVNPSAQKTKYATISTSGDGTSWTIQGELLDFALDGSFDDYERTYFRAYRRGSGWIGTYQGRDQDTNQPGDGWATSQDGINWSLADSPINDAAHYVAQSNYDPQSYNGGSPVIVRVNNEDHMLYQSRDTTPGELRAIPLNREQPALDEGELVYNMPSWASEDGVAANAVFADKDYLYLSYHIESAADNRDLGIARTLLSEVGA